MKLNPQQLSLLDQIEAHLALFSAALLVNQSDEMTRTALVLQSLVVGLSRAITPASLKPGHDPALQRRLRRLATSLASHRESLLRHSVMTERALSSLMPAARSDVYTAPVTGVAGGYGKRSFGAYGGIGRRSGEFQMSAA